MAYFATPLVVTGLTAQPLLTVLLLGVPPVALVLLALRRRAPAVVVVALGVLLFLSPGVTGVAAAMAASVARRHRRLADVVATLVWFVAARTGGLLVGPLAAPWNQASTIEWVISTGIITTTGLVGLVWRSQQAADTERANAVQARQEVEQERIARARLAEREAIAREMHDVLAHRISLVALHAGVLAHRNDLDPEQTRETAAVIRDNAKASLDELRMVLASLRDPDAEGVEPPQPTLDSLAVLVAERSEDQPVELEMAVDPTQVLAHTSRQLFRMVQEALTNARKHAPGAPTTVRVSGTPGEELEVVVRNGLTPLAMPDDTGSGLGLVGMAERAAGVGGRVSHRRTEDEFVVEITVPWRMEP